MRVNVFESLDLFIKTTRQICPRGVGELTYDKKLSQK